MDKELTAELRSIVVSIAAIELALLGAMRAVFAEDVEAAIILDTTWPSLLSGLAGNPKDIADVTAKAEKLVRSWQGE